MSSKVAKKLKEQREQRNREKREEKRRKRDARRVGGLLPREEGVREPFVRILVVCEGARTEPAYFSGFRIRAGDVVEVLGVGMNTVSLVSETVRLRDADGEYNETWVVFDRDSFPRDHVLQALADARREGIEVAYSNEAFELWYLLHFDYCDADRTRDVYGERLSAYLGRSYQKNDPRMYDQLLDRQADAVRNAERLLLHHDGIHPADANPSTTVHRLVQRLNELSRS